MVKISASIVLFVVAFAAPALADDAADIAEGQRLAGINCAKCHALAAEGVSPLADAPPFRDIAGGYDEGELEDAFNDGIATAHPAMPDWQMTPDQARQFAAFIMSLDKAR